MNIPSTQTNDFSAKWLELISEFVIQKQYEEASELSYYYPNTLPNKLLQIVNLLSKLTLERKTGYGYWGYGSSRPIEDLILDVKKDCSPVEFAEFVKSAEKISPDLIFKSVAFSVERENYTIGEFCLNASQVVYPDSVDMAVARCKLAISALNYKREFTETNIDHLLNYFKGDTGEMVAHLTELEKKEFFIFLLGKVSPNLSSKINPYLSVLVRNKLGLKRAEVEKCLKIYSGMKPELKKEVALFIRKELLIETNELILDIGEIIKTTREDLALLDIVKSKLGSNQKNIRETVAEIQKLFNRDSMRNRLNIPHKELEVIASIIYCAETVRENQHKLQQFASGEDRPETRNQHYTSNYHEKAIEKNKERLAEYFSEILYYSRYERNDIGRDWHDLINLLIEFPNFIETATQKLLAIINRLKQATNSLNDLIRQEEQSVEKIQTTYENEIRSALRDIKQINQIFKPITEIQFHLGEERYANDMMMEHSMALNSRASIERDRDISEKEALKEETETRYTKIVFPKQCYVNEKIELSIQLLYNQPLITRILEKLFIKFKKGVEQLSVTTIISGNGFAFKNRQGELIVSRHKDSQPLVFEIYAAEEGHQFLEIEFFLQKTRIGHVVVDTDVRDEDERRYYSRRRSEFETIAKELKKRDPEQYKRYLIEYGLSDDKPFGNVAILRDIGKNLDNISLSSFKRHVLHVTWDSNKNLLNFGLPEERTGEWQIQMPELKAHVEDALRDLNAFLAEAVTRDNLGAELWESILINLKGKGGGLYENIIPAELSQIIMQWAKDDKVIVSTNEQWIPWELIYDGDDFWGKKFTLARYPRVTTGKVSEVEAHDKLSTTQSKVNKVVNIVGGDLPTLDCSKAMDQFSWLGAKAQVEVLQGKPVSDVQKISEQADVLHFTCHGRLSPNILQIHNTSNQSYNIHPDTIKMLPIKDGSLVFANACSSASPVLLFGKFNNFGWEFYLRGAEVFIGTLGAIPTTYAIEFASILYKKLLQSADMTIGDALALTKEEISKTKNIFWLLYCIYGDPDVKYSLK